MKKGKHLHLDTHEERMLTMNLILLDTSGVKVASLFFYDQYYLLILFQTTEPFKIVENDNLSAIYMYKTSSCNYLTHTIVN